MQSAGNRYALAMKVFAENKLQETLRPTHEVPLQICTTLAHVRVDSRRNFRLPAKPFQAQRSDRPHQSKTELGLRTAENEPNDNVAASSFCISLSAYSMTSRRQQLATKARANERLFSSIVQSQCQCQCCPASLWVGLRPAASNRGEIE